MEGISVSTQPKHTNLTGIAELKGVKTKISCHKKHCVVLRKKLKTFIFDTTTTYKIKTISFLN